MASSKANKRARKSESVENEKIHEFSKKQNKTKIMHANEKEQDVEIIDFDKIDQLIENELADMKED